MKVGIIGSGNVGSTFAFALLFQDFVSHIYITSRDRPKLSGIVDDLMDAGYPKKKLIRKCTIKDMHKTDIIIYCAGIRQKPDQDRKELFPENFSIADKYISKLAGYKNPIIIVSNPVDMITKKLEEKYPKLNLISTGLRIDGIRLRQLSGKAEIRGSHDGEQMAIVNGKESKALTEKVRAKANSIIKKKGFTCYGIAMVLVDMIREVKLSNEKAGE